MEKLVIAYFNRLPEALQLDVLHYIEFLLQQKVKPKKPIKPVFMDFHFPENGHTYSRSEIYGDDGR